MLTPKLTLIQELIAGATRDELIWLSGYLAGGMTAWRDERRSPGRDGRPAPEPSRLQLMTS